QEQSQPLFSVSGLSTRFQVSFPGYCPACEDNVRQRIGKIAPRAVRRVDGIDIRGGEGKPRTADGERKPAGGQRFLVVQLGYRLLQFELVVAHRERRLAPCMKLDMAGRQRLHKELPRAYWPGADWK